MEFCGKGIFHSPGDREQRRAEVQPQIPPAMRVQSQPSGGVSVAAAEVRYVGLRPDARQQPARAGLDAGARGGEGGGEGLIECPIEVDEAADDVGVHNRR